MAWFNWLERKKIKKNEEQNKIWKTKKKKKESKDHWSPKGWFRLGAKANIF